jgi:cytochrome P450 family 307 subfamily A
MNNYDLNMSNNLWSQPEEFSPERFLQNGRILKPDHFIPFGAGRRSCMGYKMVQLVSFSMLANVMRNFTIAPVEGQSYKVKVGSLAMPVNAYEFNLVARC